MQNYKIKVNNEAESKEAQELFFELGYYWATGLGVKNLDAKFLYVKNNKITMGYCSDYFSDSGSCELTIPKLRDLVVLSRNDVNDATHVGNYCGDFYVTFDGAIYSWGEQGAWEKDNLNTMNFIKPVQAQPTEQGLISGADALRALADGKEVELQAVGDMNWYDSTQWAVGELLCFNGRFRIKTRTITLNGIEVPAPFDPKDGDEVYFIDCDSRQGYSKDVIGGGCEPEWTQFGAWRTEEQIKKVVAALRGALKNG